MRVCRGIEGIVEMGYMSGMGLTGYFCVFVFHRRP